MQKILITDRKSPELLIKEEGVSVSLGNNSEVLSGPPVPIPNLVFPLEVTYTNGGAPRTSAIYDQMARLVNGIQVEHFFVHDSVSGFHWRPCTDCVPEYPPVQP